MEEINYIFVKIKGVQPTITFLDVIGILTTNNELYSDKYKIEEYLFGHSKVCTGKLPTTNNYENLIYSIQVQEINKNEDDEEKFPFIKYGKVVSLPQIISIDHIDLSIGYIDPTNHHLNNYINTIKIVNPNEIYLYQNDKLYGPFKFDRNLIYPIKNKEVKFFKCEEDAIITDNETNSSFYSKYLNDSLGYIDCMNNGQLIDFFKSKVSKTKEENELFNKVKNHFETINSISELDQIRVKRVKEIVEQIQFNELEINEILKEGNIWRDVFKNQIEVYEEKLKSAIKLDLSSELNEIEVLKKSFESDVDILKQKHDLILNQIENSTNDLNQIENNKNLLISSIKLQTEIGLLPSNNLIKNQSNQIYFDVVNHSYNFDSILSFDEKINEMCDDNSEKSKLENFIEVLASKSLFYCKKVEKLKSYLKIFNEYTLVYQNVEVDWIKFEKLNDNGFNYIVSSAFESPTKLHVLILNDFNIAAFELYGKSIIDVLQNRRPYIPGTNKEFPNNLKIFLVESNMTQNEDCFASEIELIDDIVGFIDLEELRFLRNIVRKDNSFTPLLWQNAQ